MAGEQLPAAIEEFASYLRALTRRIDPESGWYAVFAQRDPEGLRACLDGQEIPPWDVVQALLQDLSAQRGAQTANVAAARAATLYRASITAHDAAPGTREALRARLAAMRRERLAAADRERDLHAARRAGAETTPDGDPVDAALAWAQDDHHRATARCEELTARLAALAPAPAAPSSTAPRGAGSAPPGEGAPPGRPAAQAPGAMPGHGPVDGVAGPRLPGVGPSLRAEERPPGAARSWAAGGPQGPAAAGPQPGGARAAPPGEDGPSADSGRPPTPGVRADGARPGPGVPPPPRGARFAAAYDGAPETSGGAAAEPPSRPRGARFAGAGGAPRGARLRGGRKREREAEQRVRADERQELAEARRAAGEAVARLGRLRAEGRGGEAHAVLCETAAWPAGRLPVLAAELERAGLGADVATLLWEMSGLPPGPLAAAAEALMAAGRESDGERLLRQSVARPVAEVAHTALALLRNAAHREVPYLLTAFIRARTPAEVAEAAAEDPGALVAPLLEAASAVSPGSQHDLAHALRVAGVQR